MQLGCRCAAAVDLSKAVQVAVCWPWVSIGRRLIVIGIVCLHLCVVVSIWITVIVIVIGVRPPLFCDTFEKNQQIFAEFADTVARKYAECLLLGGVKVLSTNNMNVKLG